MTRALRLAPLLLLIGCGITSRTEYRWIGPLTASNPAQCPPTKGVLTMREGGVTFTPDEGTWVLSGTAGPDTLSASHSNPAPDHKLYKTELKAHWTRQSVRGTYTTPFCTYRVELARF